MFRMIHTFNKIYFGAESADVQLNEGPLKIVFFSLITSCVLIKGVIFIAKHGT